ncbi:hypothetical protein L209DRAFT_431489 [Thermothelomyces heterothallicus CBS 203.75]
MCTPHGLGGSGPLASIPRPARQGSAPPSAPSLACLENAVGWTGTAGSGWWRSTSFRPHWRRRELAGGWVSQKVSTGIAQAEFAD